MYWYNESHNASEYDAFGYNEEGFNKEGIYKLTGTKYTLFGHDQHGFTIDKIHKETGTQYGSNGYDISGYNKEGYNRDGYNKEGYNRDGYNKEGYNRDGYNKEGYNRDGYNKNGYNKKGYNRDGYNKNGYNKNGYNNIGYDVEGYHVSGVHRDTGYTRRGFNIHGIHKDTGTEYNLDGSNVDGLNKNIIQKTAEINLDDSRVETNHQLPLFKRFWNIKHIDELSFVLEHGICSRNKLKQLNHTPIEIANKSVVRIRNDKKVNKKLLHDYANLYFNPRNAMLTEVLALTGKENILIFEIILNINIPNVVFTDGNAARYETNDEKSYDLIQNKIRPTLYNQYWDHEEKRIMMAECLVPEVVPSQFIASIYICDIDQTEQKIKSSLRKSNRYIPIHRQKHLNPNEYPRFQFNDMNDIIDKNQLFFGGKFG